MSVLLKDLGAGDRFYFSPAGSRYVYEGAGWCHMDIDGAATRALLVEVDQVVFKAD